ncbi:MAG: ribonuclease HI family protein [Actinobacteria bacterium]|nr:ribonuclease HI family protein [Actinomycetota bacterium]
MQTQLSFGASPDEQPREALVIYSDGGARGNPGPAAIGAVVQDPSTDPPTTLATISRRIGVATNNVAEYEALIAALEAAQEFPAREIRVRADSQLLIRQLEGRYKVKHTGLRPLYDRARVLLSRYERVDLQHVPREENIVADALVNAALDTPGSAPAPEV